MQSIFVTCKVCQQLLRSNPWLRHLRGNSSPGQPCQKILFFGKVIFGAGLDSYPISRPHSVSTQCRHLSSDEAHCSVWFKLVTRRPHLHQLINIIWLVICVAPGQEHHLPIRVKVHGELQLILVVKKKIANVDNFNLRKVFKTGSKLARPLTKGEIP